MRKPLTAKALPAKQQGFSLFIVLVMMLVIAFLVIAATQSYNTEMRISSNDADRKSAYSIAEAALRQGEQDIGEFFGNITFSANCAGGLCAHGGQQAAKNINTSNGEIRLEACGNACSGTNAWERQENGRPLLETAGREYAVDAAASRPARYIIEALSSTQEADGSIKVIYRVTARAWGMNANTVVTLQSYVEGVYNS